MTEKKVKIYTKSGEQVYPEIDKSDVLPEIEKNNEFLTSVIEEESGEEPKKYAQWKPLLLSIGTGYRLNIVGTVPNISASFTVIHADGTSEDFACEGQASYSIDDVVMIENIESNQGENYNKVLNICMAGKYDNNLGKHVLKILIPNGEETMLLDETTTVVLLCDATLQFSENAPN